MHWVAYEKDAAVLLGEVAGESKKNILLASGEKIPHRRVWLARHIPLPDAPAACPPIEQLWRSAAGSTMTLPDLTAAACGSSSDSQQIAVLQTILQNPIYFQRRDKNITAVSAEQLEKSLQAVQSRQRQQQEENDTLCQLAAGSIPADIKNSMNALLYAPDKSAAAYRILKKHTGAGEHAFARFFIQHGLLPDSLSYLDGSFIQQWGELATPPAGESLTAPPPADLTTPHHVPQAISIDDKNTVEIDDAFSVSTTADGKLSIGIHIAAPALALTAAATRIANERQTSVYFPHAKHFMLPPAALAACSLSTQQPQPAISLYIEVDTAANTWQVARTSIEKIQLADSITPQAENLPAATSAILAQLEQAADIIAPDVATTTKRHNYTINAGDMTITPRRRSGITRTVEIFMRCANSIWAQQIAGGGGGGLYRSNGNTLLLPPAAPYMWLTSPLRRYADLANQQLLLARLYNTPPPSYDWHALRRRFDRRYTLARRYQRLMETHWALRILTQQNPAALTGEYLGGKRIRLCDYPLTGSVTQPPAAQTGDILTVSIDSIDILNQQLRLNLCP